MYEEQRSYKDQLYRLGAFDLIARLFDRAKMNGCRYRKWATPRWRPKLQPILPPGVISQTQGGQAGAPAQGATARGEISGHYRA